MTHLSIIIVSYNTRELTLACLRSVFEHTLSAATRFELLVVDNASSDGTAAAISAEFPQVASLALERNLGFAAANNLAAQRAHGEWLLLLNPDTVILDGAIDKLVAFAQQQSANHPQNGIFGGRTLFGDGRLNPACAWRRPTPWSAFCMASGLTSLFRGSRLFNPEAMPHWRRDAVREVDIVSGCFLLLRRALWQELGGFDPAFFMYGEEADLCLRARRLGIRALACPAATIVHHGGASEPSRAHQLVRLFRAKAQLIQRHWSGPAAAFGIRMLDLWAASRVAAFGVGRCFFPPWDERYSTWRVILARRAQWHLRVPPVVSANRKRVPVATTMPTRRRILAIASGGGHWVQLLRLRAAFQGHEVTFVTVDRAYASNVPGQRFRTVCDATRWNKLKLLCMALQIAWIVLCERPDVVVATGAAPGYFAIRLGRLLGARTIWIDSIANVERLSLSGQRIGPHADLWLTQWPHLVRPEGPHFLGSVL